MPSHTGSCTCHALPLPYDIDQHTPGSRSSVPHTHYGTLAQYLPALCSLSAISVLQLPAVRVSALQQQVHFYKTNLCVFGYTGNKIIIHLV